MWHKNKIFKIRLQQSHQALLFLLINFMFLLSCAPNKKETSPVTSSPAPVTVTYSPVATVSGVPTGSSQVVNLNVQVAGQDVVQYKYKIGLSSTTSCATETGYSSVSLISNSIAGSIASFSDGANLRLCVVGIATDGTQQSYASATVSTWTKIAVTAVIYAQMNVNIMSTANGTCLLENQIGLSDIVSYRYGIDTSGATDCSGVTTYSQEFPISTLIADESLGAYVGDGYLCAIGKNSAGRWQSVNAATPKYFYCYSD